MEQVGKEMPDVVGVDGCKGGWVAVRLFGQGEHEVKIFPNIEQLLSYHHAVNLILVDIPIGLPEGPEGRECDPEARAFIRHLYRSVFRTPCRQTCEQVASDPKNHDKAKKVESRCSGKSISAQAMGIAKKIAEMDGISRARPSGDALRVREVHPEVCFCALNHRRPLQYPKKGKFGSKGQTERLEILHRIESRTGAIVADGLRRRGVAQDDVVDALAAAVTGYYGYHALQTLPPSPCHDAKGLPMEMVYWVPPAMQ